MPRSATHFGVVVGLPLTLTVYKWNQPNGTPGQDLEGICRIVLMFTN